MFGPHFVVGSGGFVVARERFVSQWSFDKGVN